MMVNVEFPAIEFKDSVVGREAYIVGSRLAIWEVLMIAEGYGLDVGATAQHLQLDNDRVSQALQYASRFESEVRQALDENRAITPERLRALLPLGSLIEIR